MATVSTDTVAKDCSETTVAGETICVRGCRVHNLRNIDLDIPRDQLVVITGPSGSGKSSLAFDTLYAEGQRQYIESLSAYARQFLTQLERPDVDLVEGLQPTIAIDQRAGAANPRSTVATVTEIYDYLRLLYARVGDAHCYQCGAPISQQSPDQILDTLLALPEGTKLIVMAPLVRGRKGQHEDVLAAVRKAGFVRARVDGTVYDLDAIPKLVRQKNHTIEAVVDRLVVRDGVRARAAESLATTLRHGQGLVTAAYQIPGGDSASPWEERIFSTEYACPNCKISYEELEPRTFSFNSPYGACPKCEGLGVLRAFDPELVAPQTSMSLAEGAILPWRLPRKNGNAPGLSQAHAEALGALADAGGFQLDTPLDDLRPKMRQVLWQGTGNTPGVLHLLDEEFAAAAAIEGGESECERLELFRDETPCPECRGARLRPEARSVLIGGKPIHEATALPVGGAHEFFAGQQFTGDRLTIATPLLREIIARLDFLRKVGLDYLALERAADTLSGGELQRIRLATGLGSALVGICYILDEPSIALHPRDNGRLIEALRGLQQAGNTVLVVEHDEAMMRSADWLIDVGPGAGNQGGTIVAQGTPAAVIAEADSITGQYLSGALRIDVPIQRRAVNPRRAITIEGATCHNLKNVEVSFPLSALVCVTGVSGSGKSSLVNETLAKAVGRRLNGAGPKPGPHTSLRGLAQIDKFVDVDQSPIGRTPRSNPATYTGLFDEIRKVYTQTREARLRGYKSGRFSFNVAGGRCEHCQGQGQIKVEMNFLPDLYVDCPICRGARFNQQTLEVHYRDRSIADVLAMSVDEALGFFANFPVIHRLLESLQLVGLGYLPLGQSSTTLSGGEAQRIKLAADLGRTNTGQTLYVLDEPTTGLHFDDVRRLLAVLGKLVDLGNTVVVIEHNLDVIKCADWIIDLGPEGGDGGGYVLFTGTPEELAASDDSVTGRWLREALRS
ncbi:MAG TPA: excinuclease ABC subunit UvrA [Pirellulales bacterium]|jgi:excinuclease ABC subunit A|nr:excinuclease ABC subunit UvrA [Pirellulales bacterium]